MKDTFTIDRLRAIPLFCITVGVAALVASGLLIVSHANVINEVKSISVPMLSELPSLERRLDILRNQVDAAQLHAAMRTGSPEERVYAYVLPKEPVFDRLLAALDLTADVLKKQGALTKMSSIEIGDPEETEDHRKTYPVSVEFSVNEDGLRSILLLVRIAGLLTVSDALTPSEQALLLERTEAENPAGIVAMEQFLSSDLLSYAHDPRSKEEELFRSFPSSDFVTMLSSVTNTSLLREAQILFDGPLGAAFLDRTLWPLPFLTEENIVVEQGGAEGWYHLALDLRLQTRGE